MSLSGTLAWPLIALVRLYQRAVSPLMTPRCKYSPTCSHYAVTALKIHGLFKGTALAAWRLLRCNPWSDGGVDYVPDRGHWKPRAWVPPEDWVGNLEPFSVVRPLPMGLDPQWESDVYRAVTPTVSLKEESRDNLANRVENLDVSAHAELVSGTRVPQGI